jgi:hypothetical protein
MLAFSMLGLLHALKTRSPSAFALCQISDAVVERSLLQYIESTSPVISQIYAAFREPEDKRLESMRLAFGEDLFEDPELDGCCFVSNDVLDYIFVLQPGKLGISCIVKTIFYRENLQENHKWYTTLHGGFKPGFFYSSTEASKQWWSRCIRGTRLTHSLLAAMARGEDPFSTFR